jgi:antitoxin VapB
MATRFPGQATLFKPMQGTPDTTASIRAHLPVDLPVALQRTKPGPPPPEVVYFRVVTHLHVVIAVPLNIRSEETEELANALAKLTGETKTEAVTQALRERLQRVRRARAKRRLADELDEIALHCSALPARDQRTADEIMGYDDNGLPR